MKDHAWAPVLDGAPVTDAHVARVRALAERLVGIHAEKPRNPPPFAHATALRRGDDDALDRLANGPDALVTRVRGEALDHEFVRWRWRLGVRGDRLRAVHGSIEPRLLFEGSVEALGPASAGDPAVDLAPLAAWLLGVGLADPPLFRDGLARLWDALFVAYLGASGDAELLDVAPPFFARAALRLAAEGELPRSARVGLVDAAEAALRARAFDPDHVVAFLR